MDVDHNTNLDRGIDSGEDEEDDADDAIVNDNTSLGDDDTGLGDDENGLGDGDGDSCADSEAVRKAREEKFNVQWKTATRTNEEVLGESF